MINIKENGKPLMHFWSKCVGAGRANEGLRAAWQEHLKTVVDECGFEYVRFHGLFHDDMCVYRIIDGEEVFNFQYIDDLFDAMLKIGIRPVVELAFMPSDMTDETRTLFWWKANVNPPSDWNKWGELVSKAVSHFAERYGVDEVKKWYFEVWNEPNLHNAFWTGGKAKYFKMYKVTSKAVKSVDPEFKVGGPATSNYVPDDRFAGDTDDTSKHMTHKLKNIDDADWHPVWIEEFMDFCEKNDLPVDFISEHPYPTDFALDGHGETTGRSRKADSIRDDLKLIREIVNNSPYKNAEILMTEWSSSPSPRDNSHDYAPAAAYIVKSNIESRGYVDALAYWTFTDIFEEGGAGNTAFHGGFGMINYQGIKKPAYYAYKFLNELGDTEVAVGENYIVTKDSLRGKAAILAWNYDSDTMKTALTMTNSFEDTEAVVKEGKKKHTSFEVGGFDPEVCFSVETVNDKHGCAMGLYKKLGYPSSLSPRKIRLLKNRAESIKTDVIKADKRGVLKVERNMKPWEIMLITEL